MASLPHESQMTAPIEEASSVTKSPSSKCVVLPSIAGYHTLRFVSPPLQDNNLYKGVHISIMKMPDDLRQALVGSVLADNPLPLQVLYLSVVDKKSRAYARGLREGDIPLQYNNKCWTFDTLTNCPFLRDPKLVPLTLFVLRKQSPFTRGGGMTPFPRATVTPVPSPDETTTMLKNDPNEALNMLTTNDDTTGKVPEVQDNREGSLRSANGAIDPATAPNAPPAADMAFVSMQCTTMHDSIAPPAHSSTEERPAKLVVWAAPGKLSKNPHANDEGNRTYTALILEHAPLFQLSDKRVRGEIIDGILAQFEFVEHDGRPSKHPQVRSRLYSRLYNCSTAPPKKVMDLSVDDAKPRAVDNFTPRDDTESQSATTGPSANETAKAIVMGGRGYGTQSLGNKECRTMICQLAPLYQQSTEEEKEQIIVQVASKFTFQEPDGLPTSPEKVLGRIRYKFNNVLVPAPAKASPPPSQDEPQGKRMKVRVLPKYPTTSGKGDLEAIVIPRGTVDQMACDDSPMAGSGEDVQGQPTDKATVTTKPAVIGGMKHYNEPGNIAIREMISKLARSFRISSKEEQEKMLESVISQFRFVEPNGNPTLPEEIRKRTLNKFHHAHNSAKAAKEKKQSRTGSVSSEEQPHDSVPEFVSRKAKSSATKRIAQIQSPPQKKPKIAPSEKLIVRSVRGRGKCNRPFFDLVASWSKKYASASTKRKQKIVEIILAKCQFVDSEGNELHEKDAKKKVIQRITRSPKKTTTIFPNDSDDDESSSSDDDNGDDGKSEESSFADEDASKKQRTKQVRAASGPKCMTGSSEKMDMGTTKTHAQQATVWDAIQPTDTVAAIRSMSMGDVVTRLLNYSNLPKENEYVTRFQELLNDKQQVLSFLFGHGIRDALALIDRKNAIKIQACGWELIVVIRQMSPWDGIDHTLVDEGVGPLMVASLEECSMLEYFTLLVDSFTEFFDMSNTLIQAFLETDHAAAALFRVINSFEGTNESDITAHVAAFQNWLGLVKQVSSRLDVQTKADVAKDALGAIGLVKSYCKNDADIQGAAKEVIMNLI